MANPSSMAHDLSLQTIPQYRSFPVMLPFVGEQYDSANHSRLLIVGESFYFPATSTSHKDAGIWYSMHEDQLTENERAHINCRALLECKWESPGHKMYRELNACLASLPLPVPVDRPVSHISFTNAFHRPAGDPGKSFRYCCTDQDIAVGIDVMIRVIDVLSPDLVIVASRFAWDAIGATVAKRASRATCDFVSHPTDSFHWNVTSYNHGKAKFMALLASWATQGQEGTKKGVILD